MTVSAVTSPELFNEAAEQFRYSFGVRAGDTLYISGQVAFKDGGIVGIDDIEVQARQVFENLKTVVEAAGGTLDDIVATTTYLLDRAHSPVVNELRKEYLTGPVPPTSTLVIVAGLGRPQFLLEISAVAYLGPR